MQLGWQPRKPPFAMEWLARWDMQVVLLRGFANTRKLDR